MKPRRLGNYFRCGCFAISGLSLLACASLRQSSIQDSPIQLPVVLQPLFSACAPSDGSVYLSLKGGTKNISGLEMVWNVPSLEKWDIQFNSLLGETQMEIQKRGPQIEVVGRKDVQVSREGSGALMINDVRLPLLEDEIPCLMSGHWPANWLAMMQRPTGKSEGSQLRLTGWDELRSLDMVSSLAKGARIVESCTVIEWGGFLGLFKYSSKMCLKRWSGGYAVAINGPSDYSINWSVENEPN